MRKNIRKLLAMCVALVLVISLLTACGQSQEGTGTTAPDGSTTGSGDKAQTGNTETSSSGPEALTLPIVKEPLKLTVFAPLDSKAGMLVSSYEEVASFKELEERTGIDIEWQHPPAGQEIEQFNLMLASQELPDMIYYNWSSIPGGPEKAIQDGQIIKLNDLINKYAPNFTKILEENQNVRQQAVTDSGTLYMFPMLVGSLMKGGNPQDNFYLGPQFRKDWLDKLNLSAPTTIEQWHDVLTAFKQKDPNGNGQVDELPFISNKDGGLRNLASAWGILYDFYVGNGEIKYGPIEPAFKDYIGTLRKWYAEGLIDPDYLATDSKNFNAKVTGNLAGSYIGSLGGQYGTFTTLMKDKDPNFKLAGAQWPIGPVGKSYTAQFGVNYASGGAGMAITTANKHQAESTKWIDYQYSPEGVILMNFGIEGESYVKDGDKIKYTDAIAKDPQGRSIDMVMGQYAVGGISGWSTIQHQWCNELNRTVPGQQELPKIYGQASTELISPPLTPTQEESSRLASIMNEINTYRDEMFNKFIMGQEPMENFDAFVQNIENMGIDEALKIENDALVRYNNR